uniref:helix-turn-helix domain-containing protein n=1 Tax=Clostridium thailandense TaxID=2794346 RepID=UPI001FE4D8B4|nr:helix-turn-helix domain-containing protein [Clostridium thailandense]
MREKQEIILKHLRKGKSQRQICRDTGIARETIRRYTRAYEPGDVVEFDFGVVKLETKDGILR